MKQTLFSLFLALLPLAASADAVEIGGIYYNLVSKVKTAEVTSNPNGYWGTVNIPETITYNDITYNVTSIGYRAFYYSILTSVIIPNSVTSIGEAAFQFCSGLTSLTVPNSVTSIGGEAFSYCRSLTSVTIPNSVTSIGNCAFWDCCGLTSVTIPNSVTSIGRSVFYGCSGLTSVTIPNSVTSINAQTFYGCTSLTSVTIPNSVNSIGDRAFNGCSGLTSVTIPNSVTSIGYSAFANCPELLDVYCWAENVPYTDASAFNDSYINFVTLHVPAASVNAYKEKEPWKNFKEIVPLEDVTLEKCATPTIVYANGDLSFTCETEGVEYVYDMKVSGAKAGTGCSVKVNPTLTVSVYATKDGYLNSETATKEIDLIGAKGDVSGDGTVDATDLTRLIDILLKRTN